MADEIIPNAVGMGNYPKRLTDMRDGTWAEKVFATLALGGTQVSSANPLPVVIASGAASLADQSVVDGAGTYWLVRDNGSALTYLNWSTGNTGTPVAPVAPAGKLTGEQILSTQYNAVNDGTGYATGEVLAHIVILNIATNPATVIAGTWLNITQSAVLATAPPTSAVAEITASVAVNALPALPAGSNAIGSVAVNAMPPIPAGSNTIGAVNLAGSLPGFATTPSVSVATMPPLPTGANLIGAVNLDIGGTTISPTNPLPVLNAYTAPSTVTWTTASTANTAASFSTNGYDTAIVTLATSATYAGGVVVFEVFDGASWMPVKAANIANYSTTGNTIAPSAGSTNGYQIAVAGFPQFRVRLATVMSAGTLGVTTIISSAPDVSVVTAGLDPTQPLPAGSNAIGSVSVSALPALPQGTNAIGSVITDNATDNTVIGPTSVTSATTIVSASTQGFGGGVFSLSAVGTTCTISFQQSWDNTAWRALEAWSPTGPGNGLVATATTVGAYGFNASAPYVRAQVTTYGSGTVTCVLVLKRGPQWWPAFVMPGANAIGTLGASTALIGDVGVEYRANATGAAAAASILSPATPAGASIKGSAGRIAGWTLTNSAAAVRSVKFYNTTSVTLGTTAASFEIDIPAGATVQLAPPGGIGFATGIMWAVTGAKGLTDNTATGLVANDVSGVVIYA
jgi:hypothetical protein